MKIKMPHDASQEKNGCQKKIFLKNFNLYANKIKFHSNVMFFEKKNLYFIIKKNNL